MLEDPGSAGRTFALLIKILQLDRVPASLCNSCSAVGTFRVLAIMGGRVAYIDIAKVF